MNAKVRATIRTDMRVHRKPTLELNLADTGPSVFYCSTTLLLKITSGTISILRHIFTSSVAVVTVVSDAFAFIEMLSLRVP
jgi:hypothetical protein